PPLLPPLADAEHLVEMFARDDREHTLLRLAGHDLDGLHAGLARRDLRQVHIHSRAALGRGLTRRAGEPGSAEILHADREASVEQREAGLDEPLLFERITDLHAGTLRGIRRF